MRIREGIIYGNAIFPLLDPSPCGVRVFLFKKRFPFDSRRTDGLVCMINNKHKPCCSALASSSLVFICVDSGRGGKRKNKNINKLRSTCVFHKVPVSSHIESV